MRILNPPPPQLTLLLLMGQSEHTVTRYLGDEKLHGGLNNKMFQRLGFVIDQL